MIHIHIHGYAQVGSSLVSSHYPANLLAILREGATSPPVGITPLAPPSKVQFGLFDHRDPPQNLMLIRATMMSVHICMSRLCLSAGSLLVHPKPKTVLGLW